jgi:hypothetical protein
MERVSTLTQLKLDFVELSALPFIQEGDTSAAAAKAFNDKLATLFGRPGVAMFRNVVRAMEASGGTRAFCTYTRLADLKCLLLLGGPSLARGAFSRRKSGANFWFEQQDSEVLVMCYSRRTRQRGAPRARAAKRREASPRKARPTSAAPRPVSAAPKAAPRPASVTPEDEICFGPALANREHLQALQDFLDQEDDDCPRWGDAVEPHSG